MCEREDGHSDRNDEGKIDELGGKHWRWQVTQAEYTDGILGNHLADLQMWSTSNDDDITRVN